jgi:hypothetical protein
MAAYKNKTTVGKNASKQQSMKTTEDDVSPKPLSATLLQEFQNIKDKFKNEDEEGEKGEVVFTLFYFFF